MVLAAALLIGAPRAEAVSFSGPTNFAAGGLPFSVAVGDFSGDSDPDLAVANAGTDNVSILLGAAGGTFTAPTDFGAGDGPRSVAVGEFNGDSDPDLAVANFFSDNVSILLGAAGGTFTAPTDFGAGDGPFSVAVGEFSGDSDPDLAVANIFSDNVSILLGAAGGTFTAPTDFAAGDGPRSVAVGEFSGDSDPDLAVANIASDNVSILLGAAGGTFTGPTSFAAGDAPLSVAVGEFSGDSDADLAVANLNSDNVSILLGAAGGTFTGPTDFGAGDSPQSVAVGEFSGDSDPDLAVANAGSDNVSILLGAAGGTFTGPTNFAAGDGPVSVAVGEFNGDALDDLAVANADNVSILLGQAEPTLQTAATGATIGATIHDTATLAGGSSPTGTITFNLYGPGDVTCAGAPVFTDVVAVAGNGNYDSADFTPAALGAYNWTATYSGDATNVAASSPCGAVGETSIVSRASPTLTTNASAGVTLGANVSDTASLAGGSSPTGQITFRLYGPGDATCANPALFTDTVNVNAGNGSYQSANFTPVQAGTYRWIASYSGDANNDPVAGACDDANESVAVSTGPPTPDPEIIVTGLERDREAGTATLTVAANLAGNLRVAKTNKVKGFGPVALNEPGSAELEIVPRNRAAEKLARTGRLSVNPRIRFATDAAEIGIRHEFDLRRD